MAEEEMQVEMSSNWLMVYPTETEEEHQYLVDLAHGMGQNPDSKQIVLGLSDALDTGKFGERNLTGKQKKLLSKVMGFIAEGIELGMDESVNHRMREVTQANLHRILREEVRRGEAEDATYYSGDYRGPMIGAVVGKDGGVVRRQSDVGGSEKLKDETYVPHEQVEDTVYFMKKRIERLLAQDRGEPVVVIDIGAMYAGTMLELGDYFCEAVTAGKLVLVATNLVMTREVIEKAPRKRNGTGLEVNYENVYEKGKDLVQFVTGDVTSLLGLEVTLPNGNKFKLTEGSCDLVHESWSISAHSKTLEKDVAILARLLNEKGLLLSRRRDQLRTHHGIVDPGWSERARGRAAGVNASFANARFEKTGDPEYDEYNWELWRARDNFMMRDLGADVHERAADNLRLHGFRWVNQVEEKEGREVRELNYSIWAREATDPLVFWDEVGREFEEKKRSMGVD